MDIVHYLIDNPHTFLLIVGVYSLFVGSFLNVVIYRLPRILDQQWGEECRQYLGLKSHTETEKLTLYLPFSHCPRCKKNIRPWHNIPIFSYLWLRGRCAYCKAHISARYPFVELLTCLISLFIAWEFGVTWHTLAALLITWICICLTYIDIDFHLLPDQLTLLLLWLGLIFSLFNLFCDSHDAILGAIGGYLIFAVTQTVFHFFTGKIGMGQGDYKLLAAFGALFGWQFLPMIILLASISGIIGAIINMIVKHNYRSVPLPFGPYLAFGGWIILLHGNELMQHYIDWAY